MGAEKWLDIELWNSVQECFKVLTSRGYRIATTHVGIDAVFSILLMFLSVILFPVIVVHCGVQFQECVSAIFSS